MLTALQRCGEFMPIRPSAEGTSLSGEEISHMEQGMASAKEHQTEELLKKTRQYEPKKGMFSNRPEVDYSDFSSLDEKALTLRNQLSDSLETLTALTAEETGIISRQKQLSPWLGLHTDVKDLAASVYTVVFSGFIPPAKMEAVTEAVTQANAELETFQAGAEGTASIVICLRGEETDLLAKLREAGFSESAIPIKSGKVKEEYDLLSKRAQALSKEIEKQKANIEKLSKRSDELRLLSDQYRAESERESAPVEETMQTVYLEGWVRSDRVDKLKKTIRKVTDVYELAFYDPRPEEVVPTVTKNNRFISQFETITDMFSRPQYGGTDPNPVMGLWYWVIYGMMMGDVGYGFMMLVGLLVFKKVKKPRGQMASIVNVLFLSSFTTIIFGVLFGSYFGEKWFEPILFGPLDQPIYMLIFSLAVGVLHIFTGMIMKMIIDIKAHRVWDAIFDQLSWMFIITGLILLVYEPLKMVGIIMAVLGAVTILLTGGRSKKGFGKVTGGIMGLYNITSFLSDILSYARIMALGLATGVIGMVMNILAGMVLNISFVGIPLALVVYAIGHVFNLAMSMLSAYVHDSRLQYIEFYNKFYDGGGMEFRPLSIQTQYVDLAKDQDQD